MLEYKLTHPERIRLEALKLSCAVMSGHPLDARIAGAKKLADYIQGINTDDHS